MKVGAAKTEGADRSAAGRCPGREPRALFRGQVKRGLLSGNLTQGVGDLDGWGDDLVVQGKGRLDETCRAGSRLGVSDLGLHRTQGAPGGPGLAVHLAQGLDLHGVPHPGAGTVGLDETDTFGGHAGPVVSIVERLFLSAGAGGVDGVPPAVAGGTDPPDHRIDPVSVPLRVGQPLDDHDPQPLTQNRPVGGGVEGFRVAGGGECRGLAEAHVHEDVVKGIDAAGDHHIGLTRGQFHPGQVKGAEGTGTGGVHHAVGPSQVVLLADPAGHHIPQESGKRVFLPVDIGV